VFAKNNDFHRTVEEETVSDGVLRWSTMRLAKDWPLLMDYRRAWPVRHVFMGYCTMK